VDAGGAGEDAALATALAVKVREAVKVRAAVEIVAAGVIAVDAPALVDVRGGGVGKRP